MMGDREVRSEVFPGGGNWWHFRNNWKMHRMKCKARRTYKKYKKAEKETSA